MYAMLMDRPKPFPTLRCTGFWQLFPYLMFFLSFLLAKNQPGAGGQVAMH